MARRRRFRWDDGPLQRKVMRGARRGVFKAAHRFRSQTINYILRTKKTGRFYRRRGVLHQASAPGESPASDTGRLVNSITVVMNLAELSAVIQANTRYAEWLEYGTENMEPRPFFRPTMTYLRPELYRIIQREIQTELRK